MYVVDRGKCLHTVNECMCRLHTYVYVHKYTRICMQAHM